MNDFETDLRKRRKKKLERERQRRLKNIKDDYQKAQDFESGKQT